MIENFDDIVKAKLSDAVSEPPDGLWSKIAHNMASSPSLNDEAIRSKLEKPEIAPPPHLWKKIAATLKPKIPFYKSPVFRRIAAAFILLGFASYLYFNKPSGESIEPKIAESQPIAPIESLHKEAAQPLKPTTDNPSFDEKATPRENTIEPRELKIESSTTESQATVVKKNSGIKNSNRYKTFYSTDDIPTLAVSQHPISSVVYQAIPVLTSKVAKIQPKINQPEEVVLIKESIVAVDNVVANENVEPHIDTLQTDTAKIHNPLVASNENAADKKEDYQEKPGTLPLNPRNIDKKGLSLSYNPSNIVTGFNNVNQHELDVSFTYQNIHLIAELGLGFGMSEEKTPYTIDYSRYEFVKMQFVTDSLSFTFDPVNQTYTPVAYGHQEKVYDDIDHSFSSIALTQNYWMNIPFHVGYVKNLKRFSLKAGLGIKYSVLLSSKIKGLYELDNQSVMKNFYFPSQNRTKTNISYSLNAGIIFKLTERLHFNTEAVALFYQYPAYIESTQRAYGHGLRTGFTYYFL
ncbi:MAG: hypothetical protein JXR34_03415 [Bacteroidales bacterium]|nr:hypothetical protein [Bacteroidales bacterium]